MQPRVTWPDGKAFAFTVFDDTDRATLENAPLVYSFLRDLGFCTTKSVWPLRGSVEAEDGGSTCADANYLAWVKGLQRDGFEIALHNVTFDTSTRDVVQHGLDEFAEMFGHAPRVHANHYGCREAIYWGDARLSGWRRWAYLAMHRFNRRGDFQGHVEGSELFWGDICQAQIDYVRNFVFADINTLAQVPFMPYYDPARPYVNGWFASSEAPDMNAFAKLLAEDNQNRLQRDGGACIVYTHFGAGFVKNGVLDERFCRLMEGMSRRNGWFVPVSTLLDYLRQEHHGLHQISDAQRARIETRWLIDKIRSGGTS